MEENNKSKVYALIDTEGRVKRIDGGYSIGNVDLDTWIFIDEGYGDKFNLCQSHYLEKPIITEDGIYRYKFYRKKIVERTEEEMNADRQEFSPVPSQLDIIEAQVMYTALLTDTLIEG